MTLLAVLSLTYLAVTCSAVVGNIPEADQQHRAQSVLAQCADHAIEMRGKAVVRHNMLLEGNSSGFARTDHHSKSLYLQVIHCTIVPNGHAVRGSSPKPREGMILFNNILDSRDIDCHTGIECVALGIGPKQVTSREHGLGDFVGLTWGCEKYYLKPTADATFAKADTKSLIETDFHGSMDTGSLCGVVVL